MGDPLGITGSVVAILQATSVAVDYFQGVWGAAKHIKDLMDELESLKRILTSLYDYAGTNPNSTVFDTPLRECLSDITALHAQLAKGFLGRGMSRLRWPLKDKECREYLNKIERLKSNIMLAMNLDRESRSKDMALRAERIETDGKRTEVLKWLNPTAYDERHREISGRRQVNTGEWLLKEGVIVDWIEGNPASRLLLGYGIPGAGKTFLSSRMIDHLRARSKGENWGVAFMYFNHSEQRAQTAIFFLSSVVKQLACQLVRLPEEVNKLYEGLNHEQIRPTFEQLYSLLIAVAKPFTQAFIICDALDECSQDERTGLLPLFDRMGKDGIRLFLTSREYPGDIQHTLQSAVKIKLSAQDGDVRVYIERKIAANPQAESLVKQAKCKERIISELQTCANGMFLLVHFQIRYLCEQTNPRQLLNALEALKDSSSGERPMDPTYDRAMETIRKSQSKGRVQLAVNTLTWLVKSRRVLTIPELQQAVSVEQHHTEFDELALPSEKIMLDVCAGLVSIDQGSNTVRLAHYTVHEYLVNNPIILKDAEFRIVMACATFLSYKDFSEGPCSSEDLLDVRYKRYPFLRYVGIHFHSHLQQCDEAVSLDLVLRFLRNIQNGLSYLQADIIRSYTFGDYPSLFQHGVHVNGSLLSLAARLGQTSVIRSLLKQGENVSGYMMGRTALHIAAELGYSSMVEVLLESGAGVSDTDHNGRTPLNIAVLYGNHEIVRFLLEKDADVLATYKEQTLLHIAASRRSQKVVKILLERGADISATDKEGQTPLHTAVSHQSQGIVRVLLEKGANVSATAGKGQTPLHIAAFCGNQEVARILFEKGASVSATDNYGRTPLHMTGAHKTQGTARFLLDIGADVSAMDDYGQTPLHIAASHNKEVVRILLEKGAGASATDKEGQTPLHIAAFCENQEVARILLEKGADFSVTDSKGQTPLHVAASHSSQEVVRILLETGADVSATDSYGRTPLHIAGVYNRQETVGMLLEIGANISATDNYGRTPLHIAASYTNKKAVIILLEKGADVSATDKEGQTPLHIAASYGCQEVVTTLLENGASTSATDGKGQTPLHIATFRGHNEIVRHLLEKGADISVMDNEGKTPVQIANPSVVRICSEYQV